VNHSQSPPFELEGLTIGEVRRALAQGGGEETLREALARLAQGDEVSRLHEQKQACYRQYLEACAQRHEAIVQEAMDEVDRERQRTGYAWLDRETRFAARRDAALQAEEEFELGEPLLAFEDWVEAGAPERYRAEGAVARIASFAQALRPGRPLIGPYPR
jgi:hypothetical protein